MGRENFTQDQLLAADAETGTILVAAAAGSGKTTVLVDRIIRKLTCENAVAPESLLVVTFTNAAAAEMKARVFKGLSDMIKAHPDRRAELTKIQSKLPSMNSSTTDAFCLKLVKANFHLLDIDAEINILDNGEATILKNKTAEEVVETMLRERPEDFQLLSENFAKTGNDIKVTETIIKLSDKSMSYPEPEKWINSLSESYKNKDINCEWTRTILDQAKNQAGYYLSMLEEAERLLYGVSDQKAKDFMERISPLMEELKSFIAISAEYDWDAATIQLNKVLEAASITSPSMGKDEGKCGERIKAILKYIKQDQIKKKLPKLFCATAAEHAEDMEALYPAVKCMTDAVLDFNDRLLEIKKKKHCYEFSDIMHFALDLLYDSERENHKTDFAEEMSREFSEIFVDEYQDTNAAQDALFRCLSRNGENLFMVGDVKQSIYRFRLADPTVFMNKCDSFPMWDGKAKASKILFRENFRCRKGIVDGVNYLFENMMSRELGDIDYDDDAKLRYGAKYYDEKSDKKSPDVVFRFLSSHKQKHTETEAAWIAEDIKRRMESDFVLTQNGIRKPKASDFAIIMRVEKVGATYKKIFEEHGLSLVTKKAEKLYEFAEVKLLLAFLKTIDNPADDVAITSIMLSPFFGFTPDELAGLKIAERAEGRYKSSVYSSAVRAADAGDEKCRAFIEKLGFFRNLAQGESCPELLRDIDAEFRYSDTVLAMKNGEIRRNNIMLLIDTASAAAGRGMGDTGSFIRYMDGLIENKADITSAASAGGDGSVKLITAHASKGLEYPFVYLAGFCDFNSDDYIYSPVFGTDSIGIKRRETSKLKRYNTIPFIASQISVKKASLSEEMRIYYVALTRAKENLIIVCSHEETENEPTAREKVNTIRNMLPENNKIPPEFLYNQSTPKNWFIAGLTGADLPAGIEVQIDDVLPEETEEAEGKETQVLPAPDEKLLEEIRKSAAFTYKYAPVASLLSKYTASSADEKGFDSYRFGKSKPQFLNEDGKLSGAEKGTATHKYMEYCDFDAAAEDIEADIERVVALGKLSRQQAESLDRGAIADFIASPVMARIKAAGENVFREKRFSVIMPLSEFEKDVPEEFADENTVLIGQIDLLFIENGEAVIVDYKTDNVKDASVLADTYREQMELYIKAVDMSMELKVKECVLYSLKTHEFVRVK